MFTIKSYVAIIVTLQSLDVNSIQQCADCIFTVATIVCTYITSYTFEYNTAAYRTGI